MTTNCYSVNNTALLIVDRYNDFMSKGGKFYERTKEIAEAVGFYDNMRKLIPVVPNSVYYLHRCCFSPYLLFTHYTDSGLGSHK